MISKKKARKAVSTAFLLTFGTVLNAVGVHFFRLPNHFSTGGAASIGILLGELTPNITAGTYTAALNLLFVIIGFVVLGKEFGKRAIYCSVLFSVVLELLELFIPVTAPLTDQKMLELLFASILPAVSSALLFNLDSSTGGTEVIALIMKKFTDLDTGKALLCVDILFTASTFFMFDFETGLYSSLGLFLKTVLIDSVMNELRRKKAMFIVTEFPDMVLDYIIDDVHRGATVWEACGAYSNQERWVILTVLNRSQALRLRNFLRDTDPNAFILSENSSEIYGKGFLKA